MNSSENSTLRGLVSGGLTGAVEISVNYPFKYVKTQLQLERNFGKDRLYSGIIDCAKQTVQKHGILGLYRGLNVFLYAPKSSIRFGVYETLKVQLTDDSGKLSGSNKFLAGLCAGALEAALINTPLETVETKLIYDQRSGKLQYRGFFHATRTIIKTEGIKGVYQGLYPSVLKQASNQGIRFYVVETLKQRYQNNNPEVPVPTLAIAVFGAIAGICSVLGNNPLDVVKTRMQGLDAWRYKNFADCFAQIWKQEGFFSFYRGASLRLGRVALEVALAFAVYDYIQDAFRRLTKYTNS